MRSLDHYPLLRVRLSLPCPLSSLAEAISLRLYGAFPARMTALVPQFMAELQTFGIGLALLHLTIAARFSKRLGGESVQRASRSTARNARRIAEAKWLSSERNFLPLLAAFSVVAAALLGGMVAPHALATASADKDASISSKTSLVVVETSGEEQDRAGALVADQGSVELAAGEPASRSVPPLLSSASLLAFEERPLSELSADAETFLASRGGKLGVAIVVPDQKTVYTYSGDELSPMASVAKVAIMLTTMNRALQQGRDLTDRELQLLRPMITQSDNEAATILWDDLGGGATVEGYLRSIAITDIIPDQSDAWGASKSSAKAMALLLADIAFGDILNQPMRELAIELLADVIPSQRWGVTAGTSENPPPGTVIGVKDGWYPARYAWWVNSAGVLEPGDGRPAYTIAVLTRGQPTLEYGIATIEGVAAPVHDALHHSAKGEGG